MLRQHQSADGAAIARAGQLRRAWWAMVRGGCFNRTEYAEARKVPPRYTPCGTTGPLGFPGRYCAACAAVICGPPAPNIICQLKLIAFARSSARVCIPGI